MSVSFSELPSWLFPLIIFCLGMNFLTLLLRSALEFYFPKLKESYAWTKVWLPSMPVLLGGSFAAIMSKYPYLDTLPTIGTRFLYGCVAGGLSSFLYRVVKAFIASRAGVRDPSTIPSPPDKEERVEVTTVQHVEETKVEEKHK